MDGATPAVVVRVKAGRTADKRRSWHVGRLASDIQRSIQQSTDQSPPAQSRSSWHSNEDWSSAPYRTAWSSTTTTKPDSGGNSDQVVHHQDKPSFSIASWAERPSVSNSAPAMDAAFAHYTTAPEPVARPQYQQLTKQFSGSSSDRGGDDDSHDEIFDVEPPIFVVPVTLMNTNSSGGDDPDAHHKRLVSTISDNYIDVVVKELRGVPHPFLVFKSPLRVCACVDHLNPHTMTMTADFGCVDKTLTCLSRYTTIY